MHAIENRACHRFFQHRLNLQVFSIKPEVLYMKHLPGFFKTQVFSKKSQPPSSQVLLIFLLFNPTNMRCRGGCIHLSCIFTDFDPPNMDIFHEKACFKKPDLPEKHVKKKPVFNLPAGFFNKTWVFSSPD
jgi:hypothetical protein